MTIGNKSLLEQLRKVPDHRSKYGKRYALHELLFASVLGIMAGIETLVELEFWMAQNKLNFKDKFGFKWRRTPKKSVLSDIYNEVNTEALQAVIYSCAGEAPKGSIAGDGKAIKGEKVNFFTVFDTETLNILHRIEFAKGQEVAALVEWLKSGEAQGKIVTADAIHFQKKVLRQRSKVKQICSVHSKTTTNSCEKQS